MRRKSEEPTSESTSRGTKQQPTEENQLAKIARIGPTKIMGCGAAPCGMATVDELCALCSVEGTAPEPEICIRLLDLPVVHACLLTQDGAEVNNYWLLPNYQWFIAIPIK